MGFGAEKIETPVEKLSGGEKVRLLLGLMPTASRTSSSSTSRRATSTSTAARR
jgi:hypothetical protein